MSSTTEEEKNIVFMINAYKLTNVKFKAQQRKKKYILIFTSIPWIILNSNL